MIDEKKIMALLRENAGKNILPYFKALDPAQIREKKPGDLVTDADEASEAFLSEHLRQMLPDSDVVGEEAVSKNPAILERLGEDKPVWIIDPIDGTYNFANGRSKWGVFLSLFHQGEILIGFMYDVLNDRFIYARKGGGTHLIEADGQAKQLWLDSAPVEMKSFKGHVGGRQPWHYKKLKGLFSEIDNIRCTLHDTWSFLTGDIDFVLHRSVTAWDHSVPFLAVTEAGGYIRAGLGKRFFACDVIGEKYLLATYNEALWNDITKAIHTAMPNV